MKIYVKKLWSLNPDKYKFILFETAIKDYRNYCRYCGKSDIINPKLKTFKEWLKTEI